MGENTKSDDDRVRAVVASEGRCKYNRILGVLGWAFAPEITFEAGRRLNRALQRLRKAGALEYVKGYWQVKS